MIMRVRQLFLPLATILALAGCASSTSLPASSGSPSDQPVNFQLVTDIPIPAGASMDNERSLILSDRDRWIGRVVMQVGSSANEVTAFYQAQMPNFNWQPLMSVTSEVSVMTYTRGDRVANVQVERRAVYGALVSVTVAPRQAETGSAGGGIRTESLPPPQSRR